MPARSSGGAEGMRSKVVYSPGYNFSVLGLEKLHPFDARKYGRAWSLVRQRLGAAIDADWIEPKVPVSEDVLLRVHTPEHLASLRSSSTVARALELWPARL